jgi:AraC family transcriptional regulator
MKISVTQDESPHPLHQGGGYQSDPCASFVAATRLPVDAPIPIQLRHVQKPSGRFLHHTGPDFTLSMLIKGGKGSVTRMNLGDGWFATPCRPGDFTFIAPKVHAEINVDIPHELFTVTLSGSTMRSVLADIAEMDLRDHGPMHAALNRDITIQSLIGRLWIETENGNIMGRLLAEDVAIAMMARLARLALRGSGMPSPDKLDDAPPLHGRRFARVISRIEDDLDADLSQATLAEAAGLSPWHFCRSFKAATGVAPHRFVVLRRLARAQQLVRMTDMTLAEIAAACGFSSHAHLTTVFRREIGVNPSELRRSA